ncbi:MAG TPA: phosphate regulon sensor protein PhoR, partial [Rhizobacter sp.]|nr:phosphate regulon sensor protein PhoR [Rhizobacter sp.]
MAMVAGAFIGYLSGESIHAPLFGVVLGGALGVALLALLDTLRGYRLIRWLSGTQENLAPRDTGFWGEIGYR